MLLTELPDTIIPSVVLEGYKSALVEATRCVVFPGTTYALASKIDDWQGNVDVVKFHHILHVCNVNIYDAV